MITKIINIINAQGLRGLIIRLVERLPKFTFTVMQKLGSKNVKSIYGVLMRKNWLDTTFRFCILGAYGHFFSNHLQSKTTKFAMLDIGANQGIYTLIGAKNKNCTRITSFEPVSNTFELLEINIKLNEVEDKCTTVKKGLGTLSQVISINILEGHSGAASLAHSFGKKEATNHEDVEIADSNILTKLDIREDNEPIICKIDVEGKELDVIEALISSKIIDDITEMFYEIHAQWVNPAEITSLLRQNGFKNFKKIGQSNSRYDVLATKY